MKKIYSIILIILLISLMVSCQKTPSQEIIASKDSEVINEAIDNGSSIVYESSDFPEHWNKKYSKYSGKFKMIIDAEIIVADVGQYPIATLKPYYVTIEQANRMIETFFGSLDVGFAIMDLTRGQLEEYIIDIKAEIAQAKKDGDEQQIANLEDVLANFKSKLKDAPEMIGIEKYNEKFKVYKDIESEQHLIEVRENPLDKKTPALQIYNILYSSLGNGYHSGVIFQDPIRQISYCNEDNSTDEALAAIVIANKFLDDVGIKVFEPSNVYKFTNKNEEGSEINSYSINYSKKYNGITIPSLIQMGGSNSYTDSEDYVDPFIWEYLQLEVEGEEIVYFEWRNMNEIDTEIAENVELLPFDEIKKNVDTQLSVKYAYVEDQNLKYSLYVDQIMLTYAAEPIKDGNYEYMLIPVWAFYGGYDYGDGCEVAEGMILKGKQDDDAPLITINAVDGSIIFGN